MLDLTSKEALASLTQIASWLVALELLVKERIPLSRHREAQEEIRRIRAEVTADAMLRQQAIEAAVWILSKSHECADALANQKPSGARWMQVVPPECKGSS